MDSMSLGEEILWLKRRAREMQESARLMRERAIRQRELAKEVRATAVGMRGLAVAQRMSLRLAGPSAEEAGGGRRPDAEMVRSA
ncbi:MULTISPECIES: hypothetical protein [unclassified Streptomyces]|uniref:hypothetical protein n=1 Tax=unclassified Streptomyces TaxID=2593676 RepID=UPI000DB93A7A|nr:MULTISPECIES: hypothetical protein [unclassified Streptomyces]MYT73028.1 hypothetical protein [Streptomyces sp. SID8367]RAJ73824.1 hypothetical protein K377_06915 [Streptomyces sp. PsTaAH-137]